MSTNEKSLPVEMTHTENQLLQAAMALSIASLMGDRMGAAVAAARFLEVNAQGTLDGQKEFLARMEAHAAATAPDTTESTTSATAPTTTSPDPVTNEKPMFLNEAEGALIASALGFTSSFFFNDVKGGEDSIRAHNMAADILGMDGQKALEDKLLAFGVYTDKEV